MTDSERAKEIWTGAFVIAALVGFFGILMTVGSASLFTTGRPAAAVFNNIGTLDVNAAVRLDGYPVGTVEGIDYIPETGRMEVEMLLTDEIPLPSAMVAVITNDGFLGEPYLELTTRIGADTTLLVLSDSVVREVDGRLIISGIDPASLDLLLARADEIMAQTKLIMLSLRGTADTIAHAISGVDAVVADPEFRANIHGTARNIHAATKELPDVVASAERTAVRVEGIVSDAEDSVALAVSHAEEAMDNARTFTYAIAERPSRLVWRDQEWEARFRDGDTTAGAVVTPARRSNPTATFAGP